VRAAAASNGVPPVISQIDHAKQRQKLQELIKRMMTSEEQEDASGADIIALYESLNPAKRSLLPLEYQAILRSKGYDIGGGGK
jgi:glutamate synthase domain-containing protein 3